MNKPTQRPPQPELVPSHGAKAALLTKKGLMFGRLISWSDGGTVIEASGDDLAGSEVRLRIQGPDKIWEKKATVLWVNKDQVSLQFEADNPAQKRGFGVIPRLQQLFHSMWTRPIDSRDGPQSANQILLQPGTLSEEQSGMDIEPVGASDKRRRRRFRINTAAQIMPLDRATARSDIAMITNASSKGVLFISDRAYPLGTKLQVMYPYPNSTSLKQEGAVVRVEMHSDGRQRVAVAFA